MQAIQWGIAIHELLKIEGRRRLAHDDQLDPDDLMVRGAASAPWRDDAAYIDLARSCIIGFRDFIKDQELELLRVEEYVRSSERRLQGHPLLTVWFSGRVDVVARRPNGRLVLVDAKTGAHLPAPLELAILPSTFIYTYLGLCLRSQQPVIQAATTADIEVLQVLPHKGEWTHAQLDGPAMAAGQAWVRRMVVALDEGLNVPTPGEHCAYCPISDQCPKRPQPADWEEGPL